ncbi:MAG: DNRLRE domain-containing protein, partial [Chloroflexi bacterium]|nr:DNRLRE domain-containing protein [Chloroflexota bacterium]
MRKHPDGDTAKNTDSTFTTRFNSRPVHWRDAKTGELKDFDNTVRSIQGARALPGFAYENSANGFRSAFADGARAGRGDPLARFSLDDAAVSMSMARARPALADVDGASVTYRDVFAGVDLRYTVDGERLKEDIVLHSAAAVRRLAEGDAAPVLAFDLTLDGVTATLGKDGSVSFAGADGATRFVIPRPFMADNGAAGGSHSYDVEVTLTPNGAGRLRLELRPDRAWLLDSARVYPVTLDPSFITDLYQFAGGGLGAQDTYIGGNSSAHYLDAVLKVGMAENGNNAIIQFLGLESLPADSLITSATLGLYATGGGSGSGSIEVRRNVAAWNEGAISSSLPVYYPTVEATITGSQTGWNTVDLTSLVRRWVQREQPNSGVRLSQPVTETGALFVYHSSNITTASLRPYLSVTYITVNRYGMDPHWTYVAEQDHGGGLSSRVNAGGGNLVVQQAISGVAARGFSVDVAHTFNSQDPFGGDNETGGDMGQFYGTGWTMSYNLRLQEFDGGNGVKLKDGSGRWRVYLKDADAGGVRSYQRLPYYDHTLTKNLNSPPADEVFVYTVEKGLTKYYFAADGTVRKMVDRNGNTLTFAYDGTGHLTTITDVAGRTTTLAYAAAGGRLSQITDMASRVTTFSYDGSGNLTGITRGYGTAAAATSQFGYDASGQLAQITNPRGNTSYVDYELLGKWETTGNTDNWEARPDCGGATAVSQSATQAFMGAGSLRLNFTAMSCGGARRIVGSAPAPVMGVNPQELAAYVYLPAGAPALTTAFTLTDPSTVVEVAGPTQTLTAGAWNRVTWPDAPVSRPAGYMTIYFAAPAGTTYTGYVYLDQVFVRGKPNKLRDALAAHNTVAEFTHHYNLAELGDGTTLYTAQAVVATPDQIGTLQTTYYKFNQWGWLTSLQNPFSVTKFEYDTSGRMTKKTPPPANSPSDPVASSEYFYYPNTNFLQIAANLLGFSERYWVNPANGDLIYYVNFNQVQSWQNNPANGSVTTYMRDSAGNVLSEQDNIYTVSISDPVPPATYPTPSQTLRSTSYTYATGGLVATMTDPNGHITSYEYDGGSGNKGYLTKVTKAPYVGGGAARVTTLVRNTDGSVQQETDATGKVATYEYDGLGRIKKVNFGVVSGTPLFWEATTYDLNGAVATKTNGRGNVTTYQYDANNRLTATVDALSHTTSFAYFTNGWRSSMTDPDSRVTSYSYDIMGRVLTVTEPGNYVTTYTYDLRGNRKSRVDPNNKTTGYVYDAGSQPTQITYTSPMTAVGYAYDANGNRTGMTDGSGSVTYTYDVLNRMTAVDRVVSGVASTTTYAYDAAGNRTSITYPSSLWSATAAYTYYPDSLMKTTTFGLLGASHQVQYTYDAVGRLTTITNPNSTSAAQTYDAAGRMLSTSSTGPSGTITSFTYTLDGAGNRTQAQEAWRHPSLGLQSRTVTYAYDALDRLMTETPPLVNLGDQQSSYTYDN